MGRVSKYVYFEGSLAICHECGGMFLSNRYSNGDVYHCPDCGTELDITNERRYSINREVFLRFRRYESVQKYRSKARVIAKEIES